MKVEVGADVGGAEAGAKEYERAVEGTGGDDDALGFDEEGAGGSVSATDGAMGVPGRPGALDSGSGLFTVDFFEEDFIRGEAFDEMGTGASSIRKEGDSRTLFLCRSAAQSAVSAGVFTSPCILRDVLIAVAEFSSALFQHLVVRVVLDVVC